MRPSLPARSAPSVRRAGFPVASLPLLVCASALAATPIHAQQPAPTPPPDSAARAAAPDSTHAPGLDSARSPRPDSAARRDSSCVRPGPTPLGCILGGLRPDSTNVRTLFLGVGRKLLEHAAGRAPERRPPRTFGQFAATAFGPRAVLRSAVVAGVEQALGRPRRWPRTGEGYALRFGTRLGAEVLATGVRYEVVSHLDEWMAPFQPCACADPWGRLAHALASPFRAASPSGEHFSPLTPMTELAGGMVVAAVASGGVHPGQAATAGLTGLLSLSVVAVLEEFRPWERWLK